MRGRVAPVLARLRVGRSSLPLIATPAMTAAAGLATSVLVARVFGPAGRGEYALVIATIMAVAQVVSMGLGEALAIDIARHGGPRRPRWWLASLWLGVSMSAAMALGSGLSNAYVVIGIATTSCFLQATTYALAAGRSHLWAAAQLLQPFAVFGFACHAFVFGGDVDRLLLAYAVTPAVGALIALAAVPDRGESTTARATRRIVTVGAQRQLTVTALALLRRVDILALGVLASLHELGPYAVALSIVDIALILPWVLSGTVLRDELDGEPASRKTVVARMSVLVAPSLVGGLTVGYWIIPWIWGEEFRVAYWYLFALAPGVVALGAIRGLLAWRAGRGDQAVTVRRFLIALPFGAALIAVGTALAGPFGAAASGSVVFIALLACAYVGTAAPLDPRPEADPIGSTP